MKRGKGIVLRAANAAVVAILLALSAFRVSERLLTVPQVKSLANTPQPSYMIYYGGLDGPLIEQAKQYDIVIVHPRNGNITREQVKEIQSAGTLVLGYLSVGEDLRTIGLTPEQMLEDERFVGDGKGPRVDPREPGSISLAQDGYWGEASPAGTGYASYYLDDNDHDGKPDFNPYFGCAYTNIGDPLWYAELLDMTLDGGDGVAGIRELLTDSYGRGLGCDGLLLDTIDTCAPNSYTADSYPGKTRFEWTAPGAERFMWQLKSEYPNKYILQNRGLFFYNYQLPHFEYSPRRYVDLLLFESYMLDSNSSQLYSDMFFSDNRNVFAPKLNAEAGRPDGFRILSLGYAEGPEEYRLQEALTGRSDTGLAILLKDLEEARDIAGFSHYITDASLTVANDFVLEHRGGKDTQPPVWSSVHNADLYSEPVPRVGIGEAEPDENGITVRWDVAIDSGGVCYILYYQEEPFDFAADPDLEGAEKLVLSPETGDGYGYLASPDTWPYQQRITGLEAGRTYYFVIRARDYSPAGNEEKNTVVLTGTPKGGSGYVGAGDGLRLFMIAAGLIILGMTVISLARKHMTETFCIVWGFVAVIFICAGIVLQPTQWNRYISWGGLLLVLFGVVLLLAGAFFISLRISQLTRQVKELAIQVSLVNQENEMMLRELTKGQAETDREKYEEAFVRH